MGCCDKPSLRYHRKGGGPRCRILFLFAVWVAIVGYALVLHYNQRMTGARRLTEKLSNKLAEDCFDSRTLLKRCWRHERKHACGYALPFKGRKVP